MLFLKFRPLQKLNQFCYPRANIFRSTMADSVEESSSMNNQPSTINSNLDLKKEQKDDSKVKIENEATVQGTLITEGQAQVCFPGSEDNVFYNPVQEFNRDLRY